MVLIWIITVMMILAVLDYMYQWWEHNQSLKMSKEEVKEVKEEVKKPAAPVSAQQKVAPATKK